MIQHWNPSKMITRCGGWKTKQNEKNPAGQLLSPLRHLLPSKPSRQLISSVRQNSIDPIAKRSARVELFQSRTDWPSPHFHFCVRLQSASQVHLQLVKKTTALNTACSADPTANEHLARKTIQFLLFV